MPWSASNHVDERLKFVACHLDGLYSMTELCTRFGISRECGYRWLRRYRASGPAGLQNRSSAPHSHPSQISGWIREMLIEAKRAHPHWGPRKIVAFLERRRPELRLPAASTVGMLFSREGLVDHRRRSRAPDQARPIHRQPLAPNDVWAADFKGEFRTMDGRYCYPLTVTDGFSRFLLGCDALASTRERKVRGVFQRLFQVYGLPEAMRTDNGLPFASPALAGLSSLSVWWIKLGIRRQRIRPGRPADNGRHERMHRTLKAETTRPPGADLRRQQLHFDAFRHEFNEERPHEALCQASPASHYHRSDRSLPARLPTPEYLGHWERRKVDARGRIRFNTHQYFLSTTLSGEYVGLEEVGDGIWSIHFYQEQLARLSERFRTVS
jgi:putative transposase